MVNSTVIVCLQLTYYAIVVVVVIIADSYGLVILDEGSFKQRLLFEKYYL